MSTALSWRTARLSVQGKRTQGLHVPFCCASRGHPSTYRWSERSKPSHIVHAESPTSPGAPVSQPMTATAETGAFVDTTMTDTKDFLAKELVALFDTGVITKEKYSPNIKFQDPLSSFDTLEGYVFMVNVLKTLFKIKFELYTIDITGNNEITARWSMGMEFWPLPWRPNLMFTGKSFYTVDPSSGLILTHTDVWDAVSDNSRLSLEAVQHVLRQVLQVQLTPDLEGPRYSVLKKAAEYEVRQYQPYVVAETQMPQGSGPAGGAGFNELAGYIFGGNQEGRKMEMTTPVFTTAPADGSTSSSMQFVMEPSKFSSLEQLPKPKDGRVATQAEAGGYVAAISFSGWAFDWEVREQEERLRRELLRDGLQPAAGYQLARYNEPTVPPFLRRNEVLIKLEQFSWP